MTSHISALHRHDCILKIIFCASLHPHPLVIVLQVLVMAIGSVKYHHAISRSAMAFNHSSMFFLYTSPCNLSQVRCHISSIIVVSSIFSCIVIIIIGEGENFRLIFMLEAIVVPFCQLYSLLSSPTLTISSVISHEVLLSPWQLNVNLLLDVLSIVLSYEFILSCLLVHSLLVTSPQSFVLDFSR